MFTPGQGRMCWEGAERNMYTLDFCTLWTLIYDFIALFLFVLNFLNWAITDTHHCLRCTTCRFDAFICCNMITMVELVKTPIVSYNHFFFVVIVCKIWSLKDSKDNVVITMLTIITMLSIRSSEYNCRFVAFAQYLLNSPTLHPR